VVPNATLVSSTVGKDTLDGCHVAEVTPPSPPLAFYVIASASPPLAPLAPGFPSDNQLAAPLAPDFAETGDHVRVNPEADGHEVLVPPPHAPFFAMDRADRSKKRQQNNKEANRKKQKDRGKILVRFHFG